MKLLLLTLIIILLGCSSKGDLGSGTEIGNGYVTAYLYDSTGAPVAHSAVRVLTTEAIPQVLDTVYSNSEGLFSFESALYDSVTFVVEGQELSLLQSDYALSEYETTLDTFYVEKVGMLKVIVDDSSSLIERDYNIEGTDILFHPSQLIKEESFWVVDLKLPAMEKVRILYKKDDTIAQFSTTFTIVPDSTTTILGTLLVDPVSLSSSGPITLTGNSTTLWYHAGLTIHKVENLSVTESITTTAQFDFSDLTTVTTGSDGTFWFGKMTGHTGYITPSGYKAIIPYPISSSAIQALASVGSNNWIAPLDSGLILKGTEDSTKLFDSIRFKILLAGEDENLWAATRTGKIYNIASDHSATISTLNGDEESDIIQDIAPDSSGNLIILTDNALHTVSSTGKVETIEIKELTLNTVVEIEYNQKGLWLRTVDALYLLQKNKLHTISWRGSPFEEQNLSATHSHLKGDFWVATEKALYQVQ